MRRNLTEPRSRVVAKAPMVFREIPHREAVQVPTMRWIAKRTEVGIMRRHNDNAPTRRKQAVKLLHRPNYVGHVFNDVDCPYFGKRVVAKRKWVAVQVCYNVGVCVWI